MTANYCSNCGSELAGGEQFCPECGVGVGVQPPPQQPVEQQPGGRAPGKTSNTLYKATYSLLAAYLVFFTVGLATSSSALFLLAFLMLPLSLITMYVDLRKLGGLLADTRPIVWVIAAILLYIAAVPYYIYKRRQWSRAPEPNRSPR